MELSFGWPGKPRLPIATTQHNTAVDRKQDLCTWGKHRDEHEAKHNGLLLVLLVY
jgi:hypothetical protein